MLYEVITRTKNVFIVNIKLFFYHGRSKLSMNQFSIFSLDIVDVNTVLIRIFLESALAFALGYSYNFV